MRKLFNAALVCLAVLPGISSAQWPEHQIRALVTTSAGGMLDVTTRIIAKKLGEELGQGVVVENKPGASGVIAASMTLSQKSDGYTLLFDTSAFSVTSLLRPTQYDAEKDFFPLVLSGDAPMMLVVPADSPIHTLADLIAAAKKSPGTLTFASAGTGLATHLAFEQLEQQAGIEMIHIPYKGGAPAMADIMSGRVTSAFTLIATTLPFIKSGKLRAIAVSSGKRIPELPDTPTIAESGIAGFDVKEWNGIFLRSGTPQDVIDKLSAALAKTLADPEVQNQLRAVGLQPTGLGPVEFGKFITSERARWKTLVTERHLTM